jgi:hypothetical protein
MRRRRIIALVVAFLLLVLPASLIWYQSHYSMTTATSFDVGSPSSRQHVLIATQGSRFKDALVRAIILHLQARPVYIKVIDVSTLPAVRDGDWTAIVLIHTWQNWKPEPHAQAFLERVHDRKLVVDVTTSGGGRGAIPGFDVISTASEMRDLPTPLAAVTRRLDELLDGVH